ncbi:MAG: (d)CMP kinase [Chloroflexi bacterium]|nr:(d)CMP kinase [Chloroflexota bacterium]
MPLPNTIAIDGPAGSGKSSVSFAIAQQIGYLFVDTGAFYRAVTLLALEQHLDLHHSGQLITLVERTRLDMTPELADDDRQFTFLADERDITCDLHSAEVDHSVSIIAADQEVRAALLNPQRLLAARGRVIMAGRDIGTVILPDADLKIYIDATLDKRAERRYEQRLRNGEPADLDEIRESLRRRDEVDSSRTNAPLLRAPDAIYLDTTSLNLEESIAAAYQIIQNGKPSLNQP